MWGPALALLLSAEPGAIKLASPGLHAVNLPKDVITFYSDHLAQQLTLQGLSVVTQTEVNTLVGLERQRQLMGCSDEESAACMAELANALGVDGAVTGTIGRVGTRFQIDLKIASATNARTLALFSGSADSEREVLKLLVEAAVSLDQQVRMRLRRPDDGAAGRIGKYWLAPAGVGVVGLVVGSVLMGVVAGQVKTLNTATAAELNPTDALALRSSASTQQIIGIVALTVGGVALVAGVLMAVLGNPQVTIVPEVSPTGGGVSLVGRFP